MHSTGLTVVWFLVIIALIPLSLWMLKRSGMVTGKAPGVLSNVKAVSQFNLGPGQRLVTVEVGSGDERKWLVLGVTAQSITNLHTMAAQGEVPSVVTPTTALASTFASVLRRTTGTTDKQG